MTRAETPDAPEFLVPSDLLKYFIIVRLKAILFTFFCLIWPLPIERMVPDSIFCCRKNPKKMTGI